MSINGLRLVTFDATNTILKFRAPPWNYYAIEARKYGFKGTAMDLKPRLLNSYKTMWQQYPNFGKNKITWEEWWSQVVKLTFQGQLDTNDDIQYLASRLIDDFKTCKCWCVDNGAESLLKLLRDCDITIGVISNFDPRLPEILRNVQIYDKIGFILTSYDVGHSKPDKLIFEHALAVHGRAKPLECLHIGDDIDNDYNAARSAGWHAVLVTSKNDKTNLISDKHIFSSLEELRITIEKNKLKLI